MIETISLAPGVTLRCFSRKGFKQSCLSLQFVRPMDRQEAALNALLPAVLLRGCEKAPDMRQVILKLDDLYGASVGTAVRRVGDYQTTGFYCGFLEDRYALPGDRIVEPMVDFLQNMLLRPVLEKGAFREDYVAGEKRNLKAAIAAQRNDKRSYANSRLMEIMCQNDSYGVPRLGDIPQVEEITAQSLYTHYEMLRKTAPLELFYVGAAEPEQVARWLKPLAVAADRQGLPPQTPFTGAPAGVHQETMEVSQGRLCMGYTTPITLRTEDFATMQVFNVLFGAGMTSKLFMQVREKLSLCYDIGSTYYGSKGILTVSAGIDPENRQLTRQEIETQLSACKAGRITEEELDGAKQALIAQLQATHDSPGAIEGYYATGALSGMGMTPEEYIRKIRQVSAEQVQQAANGLQLHTEFFLQGVQ